MMLPEVSSRFGAPMGRGWNLDSEMARVVVEMYRHAAPKDETERRHLVVAMATLAPSASVRVTVTRISIDSGGYDSGGAYWGLGDPLYYAASDCGTVDMYERAVSSRAMRVLVRERFPTAEFV